MDDMAAPTHRPERSTAAGYRWALFSWFEVPDSDHRDRVYLRRLRVIQTPWFGMYVHWIFLPDRDRALHDHPWPFVSWVIRGGYTERVRTKTSEASRTWSRWSAHRMRSRDAHSIDLIEPGTVTLVLVGRRCREWGFWTSRGWVPWRQYVALRRLGLEE